MKKKYTDGVKYAPVADVAALEAALRLFIDYDEAAAMLDMQGGAPHWSPLTVELAQTCRDLWFRDTFCKHNKKIPKHVESLVRLWEEVLG